MKKILIIMAVLFGMNGMVCAQGMGEIRGKVIDEKTGETLPGANVLVHVGSGIIGVQTDVKGNFVLKPLNPGVYTVEISFTGYQPSAITGVTVQAEKITPLNDLALSPGITIPGVEKKAYREPLIKPEPTIVMEPKDLKNMSGKEDLSKIISTITPGAYKTDDGKLGFRGAREGDYIYYVDGIKQMGGDVKVPSVAIGSIQVFAGAVPARYGDFTGACIVIETQSYFDWLNSRQ